MMAPKTFLVQAKTYFGGGKWYTLGIDYKRVVEIFSKAAMAFNPCVIRSGQVACLFCLFDFK